MRKLKRRKHNYYILYFSLFILFSCLGIGYAVLTSTLNFRITAHKNQALLIDNVKKTYGSSFVKNGDDYYNQGQTIHVKLGENKFYLLSYNESAGIMRIMDKRVYNPIAFNEYCYFPRCDMYCQDDSIGAHANSSLYNNTTSKTYIVAGDYSYLLKFGPVYWGEVGSGNYSVDSIMKQAKSRVVYSEISVMTIPDYIMSAPTPQNPINLDSYYDSLNKLGLYYYSFWFANSNGSNPLAWNGNSGIENAASPARNDKYLPVYILYIDMSKAVFESGNGTSSNPYVMS